MGILTVLSVEGTLTPNGLVLYQGGVADLWWAYAVLPYVYQGAVGHYGWLTPTQMIDGWRWGKPRQGHDHGGGFRGFVGAYVSQVFRG